MQKGISVIICCYNSVSRLYETLQHLAVQKTNAGLCCEVIIVDNASADDTASFAATTWKNFNTHIPLSVVTEHKPGLSFARQRGVGEAIYEYILFCDDDNWLANDYLEKGFELIDTNTSIGAIGGLGMAVSDMPLPECFDKYHGVYAVGEQGVTTGIINNRGYVSGAGMITPKAVFLSAVNNNFPTILTDRKEKALSGGGDVEYCLRLLLQGYNIYYSEELKFKHFIPAYRLTDEYRKGLLQGAADAQWILKEYFEAVKIKRATTRSRLQLVINASKDFIKSFMRRRKPNNASLKLLYYLFNIGFEGRNDLAVIRHFYKHKRNIKNQDVIKGG